MEEWGGGAEGGVFRVWSGDNTYQSVAQALQLTPAFGVSDIWGDGGNRALR